MGQRKSHSQGQIRIRAQKATGFIVGTENAGVPCDAVVRVPGNDEMSAFLAVAESYFFQPLL